MELRDYLQIIWKRIWLLIAVMFIVTFVTYWFAKKQPITYDASSVVSVIMSPQKDTNADFYQYGNYYNLQASTLFTDTIAVWLQDPSNVSKIYIDAGQDMSNVSLAEYGKLINTQKKPSASLQIVFNNTNKKVAEDLVNSSTRFVKNKASEWTQRGVINGLNIDISDPITADHNPVVMQKVLVGLLTSFIIGLVLIFMMNYLSKER